MPLRKPATSQTQTKNPDDSDPGMRLDPWDRACLNAFFAEWSCLRYLTGCAATDAERGTSAGLPASTLNGAAVATTLNIANRAMAIVVGIVNPEP
ncbi:hypothetical protein FAZ69_21220 [Trinickia terrae]|uniref:Uncharacterized protein n=1 Tax=Trinickia terrae TaxID=2571161 RepID=A0A4U1HZT5_9BURK|nr:hypothetical protein [Trinickia terrae]TKC86364.1 hypothetical protein FAZ69_21220 [Trinickia terrae]